MTDFLLIPRRNHRFQFIFCSPCSLVQFGDTKFLEFYSLQISLQFLPRFSRIFFFFLIFFIAFDQIFCSFFVDRSFLEFSIRKSFFFFYKSRRICSINFFTKENPIKSQTIFFFFCFLLIIPFYIV